jgi:hypothetical protein
VTALCAGPTERRREPRRPGWLTVPRPGGRYDRPRKE